MNMNLIEMQVPNSQFFLSIIPSSPELETVVRLA